MVGNRLKGYEAKAKRSCKKLAVELQTENPRPLKVPKAKAKRKPYFKEGDILAVKFEDEYGLVFVSMVEQSPRKLEYHWLALASYKQKSPPSMIF